MLDFTFLYGDLIWDDDALDVMKRYGTKVAPTDLTVILGGYMTSGGDRTSEDDLTCLSWSTSSDGRGLVCCVSCNGDYFWDWMAERRISARPALSRRDASKISLKNIHEGPNGVRIGEYGEYPQTVADKKMSAKLEELFKTKSLHLTGKKYTFDAVNKDGYTPFKATSYPEYEMDGKRYIRVPGRPYDDGSKLSTGEQAEEGKPYWVEVQPIEWLMDKSGTMVAKKCLFAGIQFGTGLTYDGIFSKTFMKRYLGNYFAKEIEPVNTKEQTKTVSNEQKPAEKKAALKEKLAVTSKGKNDPAVAVAVKGTKKSHYSLTDKSDNSHVSVVGLAKKSRAVRE